MTNLGHVAEMTGNTTHVSAFYKSSGDAETWVDLRIVPSVYASGSTPSVDTDTSLAFYFDADGYLNVSDGGSWTVLNAVSAVDTDIWQRITAKLDYSNYLADIWLNGVSLATGLSFFDNRFQFSSINLRQESAEAAYLDNVKVQDVAIEALLPYTEGFESVTLGSPPSGLWVAESGSIIASEEQAQEGTQSLKINGQATADFGGAGLGETWVDLHVYPDGSNSAPTLDPGTLVGVYFDTSGNAWISDGANWTNSGYTATLNSWQRVTIKMDYATESCDLYINDSPAGNNYSFATSALTDSLQAIRIKGTNQYIDNVNVSVTSPF